METVEIKKLKSRTLIATIILTLGIFVVTYGVIVEDEPTAIGLLLLITGTTWLFITRFRLRSLKKLDEQNAHN
jgi:hypothetical protein